MRKIIIALCCFSWTLCASIVTTSTCRGTFSSGPELGTYDVTKTTNGNCFISGGSLGFVTTGSGLAGGSINSTFTLMAYADSQGGFQVGCTSMLAGGYCGGSSTVTIDALVDLVTTGPSRAGFAQITLTGDAPRGYTNGSFSTVSAGVHSCTEAYVFGSCNEHFYTGPFLDTITLGATAIALAIHATGFGDYTTNGSAFSDSISVSFFEADGTTPALATVFDPAVSLAVSLATPAAAPVTVPEPGTLLLASLSILALIGCKADHRRV